MAFLYAIRCSLHGAALRKNVTQFHRTVTTHTTQSTGTTDKPTATGADASITPGGSRSSMVAEGQNYGLAGGQPRFSEHLDVDQVTLRFQNRMDIEASGHDTTNNEDGTNHSDAISSSLRSSLRSSSHRLTPSEHGSMHRRRRNQRQRLGRSSGSNRSWRPQKQSSSRPGKVTKTVTPRPTEHTLMEIMAPYAWAQYICALVGGFAMLPSIGAAGTLYSVRWKIHSSCTRLCFGMQCI